jgi:hypothetical protein
MKAKNSATVERCGPADRAWLTRPLLNPWEQQIGARSQAQPRLPYANLQQPVVG